MSGKTSLLSVLQLQEMCQGYRFVHQHRLDQAEAVARDVGVSGGLRCALAGVGVVNSWADCGEGGNEVVEGPCERCTRVYDADNDRFHPTPVFLEGRDEEGVLLGLLRVFLVASEVSREPNLYDNYGA